MASLSSATATQQNNTSLFASLLPNYLALEGILLEKSAMASVLILESTADYERLWLYNVVLVISPPTAFIFFLPLRLPIIEEAIDLNYIGSSDHAFFTLRGSGPALYIRIIHRLQQGGTRNTSGNRLPSQIANSWDVLGRYGGLANYCQCNDGTGHRIREALKGGVAGRGWGADANNYR